MLGVDPVGAQRAPSPGIADSRRSAQAKAPTPARLPLPAPYRDRPARKGLNPPGESGRIAHPLLAHFQTPLGERLPERGPDGKRRDCTMTRLLTGGTLI